MKQLKKVLSITLTVVMLVSFCTVSVVNTGSAYVLGDPANGSAVKLTFDGNKGIADSDPVLNGGVNFNIKYATDPADPTNTVLAVINQAAQGSAMFSIGKDGTAVTDNDASDAYEFLPETTYAVSFKYKYAVGSYAHVYKDTNTFPGIELRRGVSSSTIDKKMLYDVNNKLCTTKFTVTDICNDGTVDATDGSKVITSDPGWTTVTFYVKTPTLTEMTVSGNVQNKFVFLVPTNTGGKMTVYFDDITVDKVDDVPLALDKSYNYNFIGDATGTKWDYGTDGTVLNGTKTSENTSFFNADNTVTFGTKSTAGGFNTNVSSYRMRFAINDPDYGGYFRLKKDSLYYVTVKYKVNTAASTGSYLGIAHSAVLSGARSATEEPKLSSTHSLSVVKWSPKYTAAVTDDWQYLSTAIDASNASIADTWLYLTAYGSASQLSEFIVHSIDIKEYRAEQGVGSSMVEYVNSVELTDSSVTDVRFATSGTGVITPNASQMVAKDGSKFFMGWCIDESLTTFADDTYTTAVGINKLYAKWLDKTEASYYSIRKENTEGTYQSAGLRFKGRLNASMRSGGRQMGFIVAPKTLVDAYNASNNNSWYEINAQGKTNMSDAKIENFFEIALDGNGDKYTDDEGYKHITKNVIYEDLTTARDYQLVLTGLTQKGVTEDIKNYEFVVIMYVETFSNQYRYYYAGTQSYNSVKAVYDTNGYTGY